MLMKQLEYKHFQWNLINLLSCLQKYKKGKSYYSVCQQQNPITGNNNNNNVDVAIV
jgi:hypothetical protein